MDTYFYSIKRNNKAPHNSTLKVWKMVYGIYGPIPDLVIDNAKLMYRSDERAILEELADTGELPGFIKSAVNLQTLRNQLVANIMEIN